jgi:hypothetical protein
VKVGDHLVEKHESLNTSEFILSARRPVVSCPPQFLYNLKTLEFVIEIVSLPSDGDSDNSR